MKKYSLIVASSFGLESLVARELRDLGYDNLVIENGRVAFRGDERDIARCNIRLRTADRIFIKVAEFRALDFEELFQGTREVPWDGMIPIDGKIHVVGKSVRSKLASVRDCQSIVKKAIIETMKRKFRLSEFPETGPSYKVEVSVVKDLATLAVDTTGPGLHKRGYRTEAGEAPLRENLAAALVMLSRWTPPRVFADPLCGSGTIAIEAALIGKNIAPGLRRSFVAERWRQIPKPIWDVVREEARAQESKAAFRVLASDQDSGVLKVARQNALSAGVGDCVVFQKLPVGEFKSQKKYGCLISNPPYGLRMGDSRDVEMLYQKMGAVFSMLDAWSFFILTAYPRFEQFFGRRADRNRKLYNGDVKCYLYEFFGSFPPQAKEKLGQRFV